MEGNINLLHFVMIKIESFLKFWIVFKVVQEYKNVIVEHCLFLRNLILLMKIRGIFILVWSWPFRMSIFAMCCFLWFFFMWKILNYLSWKRSKIRWYLTHIWSTILVGLFPWREVWLKTFLRSNFWRDWAIQQWITFLEIT